MNKIEMSKNPDYCFAALKLIEQLYKFCFKVMVILKCLDE